MSIITDTLKYALSSLVVSPVPVKGNIPNFCRRVKKISDYSAWIPAFAGMTLVVQEVIRSMDVGSFGFAQGRLFGGYLFSWRIAFATIPIPKG